MRMIRSERMRTWAVLIGMVAGMGWCVGEASAASGPLEAGTAVAEITPPEGYPTYRGESQGARDPLKAKAIVLRQGDERAALVMCDLISVPRELTSPVRRKAAEATGIPFEHIAVTGTHTHTGPDYFEDMREYADRKDAGELTAEDRESYPAQLIRRVAGAIIEADEAARPAELAAGIGQTREISFNRRFVMTHGRVRFNPGSRNPEIVREAGPIDPDVHFLMVRGGDGEPRAGLTVFANHLDTVGGRKFSSDYPHFLAESLKAELGAGFVSLFGTGACGDINHFNVKLPGSERLQTETIGRTLGETVRGELGDLRPVERPRLGVRMEMVYVPMQEYSEEELAWAQEEGGEQMHSFEREFLDRRRRMKIRSLHRMRERGKAVPPTINSEPWTLPLEVQAFRVGPETAVVTLPGEVFVELGLAIKEASPFANTMVIELANASIAYVPTREAFRQGSYETINSRIAPGGGEKMVEAAVDLLESLKAEVR